MTAAVTRRSFLVGAAVSILGGVVGFVVARSSSAATAAPAGTRGNAYGPAPAGSTATGGGAASGILLTSEASVAPGQGVILKAQKVVVTKDTSNTVRAFSAVCTHQGCLVNSVSGGTISCPCHGSQFNAFTGAVVHGPATAPLPSEPITIKAGNVYLTSGR